MKKRTTIQRQITLNVILPVAGAILLIAVLNYFRTHNLLNESESAKNVLISDYIKGLIRFQDYTLHLIEENLDTKLRDVSFNLVHDRFKDTEDIEREDLKGILNELDLDAKLWAIYIIRNDGVIVNTTFAQDSGLNFFEFGDRFKDFFRNEVLKDGTFKTDRMGDEKNTNRKRKYSYQATLDRKYVVELGVYSEDATQLVQGIKNQLNEIAVNQSSVVSVDLFVGDENPLSFNSNKVIMDQNLPVFKRALDSKGIGRTYDKNSNHAYEFIYFEREQSNLYGHSVIRIITDRTVQINVIRRELIMLLVVFGVTMGILLWLIYIRSRQITTPIKKLAEKVTRITEGNLNERAEVRGNNEITTLSEKFNVMLERLEEFYNELEQKVMERTQEISQQKEEIEAQRDNLAKSNLELEKAYKEIEEHQERITDSILYAKRIQNVILPSKEYVDKVLPNSFVLYKPKDIVSGDFYWLAEYGEKICFAAVDCTGHGVPGAFMSLVGYNSLNDALKAKDNMSAAEILEELNKNVISILRQKDDSEAETVNDGMDIALCVFDKKSLKLEFSGAYRPLYLLRDSEIQEFKGDKKPIGRFMEGQGFRFTTHEIQLKKGDSIYIFSDGYCDQFGGPRGKKFLPSRFKATLAEISDQEISLQGDLLDQALLEWMGDDQEQIDDVVVIGLGIR